MKPDCGACDARLVCRWHAAEAVLDACRRKGMVIMTAEAVEEVIAHARKEEREIVAAWLRAIGNRYCVNGFEPNEIDHRPHQGC
jgi:hypothetical protein